jgi:DNA excision repair protein ERCC-2
VGLRHRVCPHEVALALCESRELVIGDYNYVFDPQVRIRRLFVDGDPDEWVLAVDEAHNLAARARGWFSETLSPADLALAGEALELRLAGGDLFHGGALQQACRGMRQALGNLRTWMDGAEEMLDGEFEFQREPGEAAFSAVFDLEALEALRGEWERHLVAYLLSCVLQGLHQARDPLLDFHRRLERFVELAARPGEAMHRVIRFEVQPDETVRPVFEVLCSWAGDWLGGQLERVAASVLFSATLKPWEWNLRELGLEGDSRVLTLEVPSPFPPENRLLAIHEGLSSRWRDRRRGLPALARLVAGVFGRVAGNTAVFLPSFAYLRDLRSRLPADLPLLVHDGSLEPALREALLRRLQRGGPKLLLTVMGGIFAEAVDYPGRMLECALVVGPGLPQLSHERELARLYYEGRGESGFDNAYRLPGLTRVLQAAGRVIRRPEDRGSILLLCDRFSELENLTLIEEFYGQRPIQTESEGELLALVERFHAAG